MDEYGEPSYKKCVNVNDLEKELSDHGITLNQACQNLVGPILRCFGDVQYRYREEFKMPEVKEEKKKPAVEEGKEDE